MILVMYIYPSEIGPDRIYYLMPNGSSGAYMGDERIRVAKSWGRQVVVVEVVVVDAAVDVERVEELERIFLLRCLSKRPYYT